MGIHPLNVVSLFKLQDRTASVDLATDTSLMVDISDALSEQEKVKFTVHTKVSPLCTRTRKRALALYSL